MKNFIKYFFVLMFACLLITGVIGLVVPFEFEKFTYGSVTSDSDRLTSSYKINFEINYSGDKEYNNVTVNIKYKTKRSGFYVYNNEEEKLENITLKNGTNKISFTCTTDTPSMLSNIETVNLEFDDGSTFQIFTTTTFFVGINWLFITFIFIGFFGCAICFAIIKSNKKTEEEQVVVKKSFDERIKEAFSPVVDTFNNMKRTYEEGKIAQQKPRKVTCKYCKGKYNSDEDKCPHCGAPPEYDD